MSIIHPEAKAIPPVLTPQLNDGLFLLMIALLIVFIFSPGRIDFPRHDQPLLMAERDFFANSWDWFVHGVFYSRTRFTFAGDYFLFRPGSHGFLVLEDLFLRSY